MRAAGSTYTPRDNMTQIFTIAETRALEAAADRAGVSYAQMMENAGRAVAEALLARLDDPSRQRFVVLCGPGNNGGDGLVAAHYLANAGARVVVYAARRLDDADPKVQRLRNQTVMLADAAQDTQGQLLASLLSGAGVIVDALFGTGARLPLAGPGAEVLRAAGQAVASRAPRPFVAAVDCPSGLDCDSGGVDPLVLPADLTVTFAGAKRGQYAFPGADAVGELVVADIGVPAGLPEAQAGARLASGAEARARLPRRPRDSHKGTFGRALIAAGSTAYCGAALLAGEAAYRVGAGLVTLAVPGPVQAVLAGHLPEATWLALPEFGGALAEEGAEAFVAEAGRSSAVLLGPGWGLGEATQRFLERFLAGRSGRRSMGFGGRGTVQGVSRPGAAGPLAQLPPLVIDADGLRLLARLGSWPARLPAGSILTPHPGEMAALTGVDKAVLQTDRLGAAERFAREWGQIVVLKGAYTVVAGPSGELTVLPFATSALARAGTGDVLAGAIAGLLAQGVSPYDAAVSAAYLHGRAGELAAGPLGNTASVLARDVLNGLVGALGE